MSFAQSSGAKIWFDESGSLDGEPLVLIAGWGAQYLGWPDGLCTLLGGAGFRVIRLDNRDVGLSQRFGGPGDMDGHYGLADMASDVRGVLDQLRVDRAHVFGHSMGGMVAQVLVLDHPQRVASLCLASTIPGQDPTYLLGSHPPFDLSRPLPSASREETIALSVQGQKALWGTRFDFDEAEAKNVAAQAYDRASGSDGLPRQWAAMARAEGRLERLRHTRTPTVLLHGKDDPSLRWTAAVAMAEAIPDAELHIYAGMGHVLVPELWPEYVAAVRRTADRALDPQGVRDA